MSDYPTFDASTVYIRLFSHGGKSILFIDDEPVLDGKDEDFTLESLTYPKIASHDVSGKWVAGRQSLVETLFDLYESEGEKVWSEMLYPKAQDFQVLWDEEMTPSEYLVKHNPKPSFKLGRIEVYA